MTEKRFKEIISTQKVIDTVTNKEYDCLLDNDLFDLINTIAEENEQLKQRNDKQYNQLKQLWELIEDEDYNTLRSMLNQRETDEKLLQKEWGTYSD